MDRRQFIAGTGVLIGSICGCANPDQQTIRSPPNTEADTEEFRSGTTENDWKTETTNNTKLPPCPDKPDPLLREKVKRFTVDFEMAYKARVIQENNLNVTFVHFPSGIADDRVEITSEKQRYYVQFQVEPAYGYKPDPNKTQAVHGDIGRYTVNYYVSKTQLRRKTGDQVGSLNEDWKEVQCPK